jgi:CDP-diacylglycerol--glycerol-3-phosphate 3-phosphatidyltransferase
MFAGLAVFLSRVQGTAGLVFTLVAAVCATLPTVASLAGAGAGGPRLNGGPFGKTERCLAVVVLVAAPGLAPLLLPIMIGMSLVTASTRLRELRRLLA